MSKTCYYETLEVERTVDDAGLKSAFRKLAMKWHPDKNPGDPSCEHKFKEISEAYEILKDGQKRAAYDRFGHAAFEQGNGGMGGGDEAFSGGQATPSRFEANACTCRQATPGCSSTTKCRHARGFGPVG